MPFPSPNSRPFCPPIFFVQILLERISSPWEPNFAALHSLQVLFSPQNSQPPLSAPNGQIQIGQGRLFFIRPISSNSELGWLELRGKAGTGNKWMGRVDLDQIGKNGPVQVNCPLKSTSGPSLEAHLVLNVGEVLEQKNGRENLGKELAERGIQTEAGIRRAEMGTQTTMEERRRKEGKTVGKEPQFGRKTMLRLLVLMMLRARKGAGGRKPKMESRSTLTRVSIPPKGDELLNILNNKKRMEIGHCRARIGYLSAVHRTMVPGAKESKMEKNLRKMKKRENGEQIRKGRRGNGGREGNGILNEGKLATTIGGMETAAFLDEGRRSSSSSGLQSMAMESGRKSPEEGGEERRIGFKREEEWRTTENAKRNDRKLREGFVQNNQLQNRPNVTGGSRFSTLNYKSKAKSSSSSSSSASKTHQQEQLSSIQRGNGTNRKDISSAVDENKESSKSKSKSSSSHSSSSSASSSSALSHHSQSKSGSKSSLAFSRQKEGQSPESGSSKSVTSKTDSSIMEMVASSVKTDSSVPVEIQSAAASSSGSNSGTMVSGGGEGRERRQLSTSRFLQDLRKQVLNDL